MILTYVRRIAAAATIAAVMSCGGAYSTAPDTTVASVTVGSTSTTTSIGGTIQLTATAKNAAGASLGGLVATWTSSAENVATVSSSGLVTAVANGSTTITATIAGKSGDRIITVAPPDLNVATVTITPATSSIAPGSSVQFTATAANAAGTALTGLTATWTSSNEAAATVSSTGLVSAIADGTTTITATISGKTATRVVTVQTITVGSSASVTAGVDNQFTPPQVDISLGGTVTWQFGAAAHNVTFGSTTGAPTNINDSQSTSVTRTFTTAGSFSYACTLHPGMNGMVVVH
jgi:plastocyanin